MINKYLTLLNKTKKGFSGITHCLIAFLIFGLFWLLPFASFFVQNIKNQNILIILIFWFCVIGSALLPDLDNNVSTAKYALGFLGNIMSVFMISVSSLIYNLFKTKKDSTKTQHRMFWHTTISCVLIYLLIIFKEKQLPDITIFSLIKNNTWFDLIKNINYIYILLILILVSSSFYLSLNVLCYRIGKVFAKKFFKILKIIVFIAFIFYMCFKISITTLSFISKAIPVGCLLHIIGDIFTEGSAPIFFPIPIKGQMWYKPKLLALIETGGSMNKILNLILFIADVILFIFIIGKGSILQNFI